MLKFLLFGIGIALFLAFIGLSASVGFVFGQINCNMSWKGLPTLLDRDCDRLADTWEVSGYNGLNLPAMGADPNVKDIFLEIDYYGAHHKPRPGVIEAVVTAFQNSGVINLPNNLTGIQLHVFVDENMNPTGPDSCMSSPFPFSTWFGTPSERSNPTLMAAKRDVFHHALFIHSQCGTTSSGTSDSPGNQLLVSLGANGWGKNSDKVTVGSVPQQAGTLMHELGHNLGLLHGGNDLVNCKPNYISVMNWAFQFPMYISTPLNAFPDYAWAFPDYSRWLSDPLIENSLSESQGIGNPPPIPDGVQTAIGGGSAGSVVKSFIPAGPPVDYSVPADMDTNDINVQRNLNNFGYSGTPSEQTCNPNIFNTLNGYKDWDSAQWKFWDTDSGWYPGSPLPLSPGAPADISAIESNKVYRVNAIQNTQGGPSQTDDITFNHTDVNMEFVRTARLQVVHEINYNIQTLPDSAFEKPASANLTRAFFQMQLIGQNNSIANLTQTDELSNAISRLNNLREKMDFIVGGNQTDDLIVDNKAQALLVPLIDNFKQVLVAQM